MGKEYRVISPNCSTDHNIHADNSLRQDVGVQSSHHKSQGEFICGWGAAFVNICVTFPINKVMFRQQLSGIRFWSAIGQLKKEGLRHLYRGLVPPLLQKTTSMSLMFGSYYNIQRIMRENHPDMWVPLNRSFSAIIAGTMEGTLTPFERIQVLMQDRSHQHRFNNTFHAFREISKHGMAEFYRGQSAILLRNCCSNVIFFLARDSLMETFPKSHDHNLSKDLFQDFISGALLGAIISTMFYPVNVVKVKMQVRIDGEFISIKKASQLVLQERNYSIRKIFRGVHINYTRSFMSWGIMNATYEFLLNKYFEEESCS